MRQLRLRRSFAVRPNSLPIDAPAFTLGLGDTCTTSLVFGPVDLPLRKRQRAFPGSALTWHRGPRQHLPASGRALVNASYLFRDNLTVLHGRSGQGDGDEAAGVTSSLHALSQCNDVAAGCGLGSPQWPSPFLPRCVRLPFCLIWSFSEPGSLVWLWSVLSARRLPISMPGGAFIRYPCLANGPLRWAKCCSSATGRNKPRVRAMELVGKAANATIEPQPAICLLKSDRGHRVYTEIEDRFLPQSDSPRAMNGAPQRPQNAGDRADQVGDHPNAGERQNLVPGVRRLTPPVVLALRPRWSQPRQGRAGKRAWGEFHVL